LQAQQGQVYRITYARCSIVLLACQAMPAMQPANCSGARRRVACK